MLAIVLVIVAILVGIISAMVGLGGGFLVVPILVLFFHVETHQAVGTSIVMVLFTALSATLAYARQRRVDYKVGLILAVGTVPGALAGAYMTTLISGKFLEALFGAFLLFIATQMIRKYKGSAGSNAGLHRMIVDAKGTSFEYTARTFPGVFLSFLGGFVSGFFGVGGGAVMVPLMVLVVGIPIHIAVATSMFIMCFTSLSGAATHLTLRNIIPEYALYLSLGIIFGTQIGAAVARRLKSQLLQRAFAASLVIVGIRMILGIL